MSKKCKPNELNYLPLKSQLPMYIYLPPTLFKQDHINESMKTFMVSLLLLLLLAHQSEPLPLSTKGRWVVDAATDLRVKLRCVNWAAHMPAVIAEGLDRRPLQYIARTTASLGFNCVRLTWATHLFTHPKYDGLTVAASLGEQGLLSAASGVARHNPRMLGMSVREAYDEVVMALGEAGLMVMLDNHVSRPQWCCGGDDGNGFFGDAYFDVEEWLRGLETVARRYMHHNQVVAMSLRNELRGPNQSEPIWYENVARGAIKIHESNPDLLVIVSGLSFDTDLSFLARRRLFVPFTNKLMLEAHWYSYSDRQKIEWAEGPPSQVCSDSIQKFHQRAGFVSDAASGGDGVVPLFVSEFGVDQRGTSQADNRFLNCFLTLAAEKDLDWALWALQGSYYMRSGQAGFDESYGVLDADWARPRNPQFEQRFELVLQMLQDPAKSDPEPLKVIYHPNSGRCLATNFIGFVYLDNCRNGGSWRHRADGMVVSAVSSAAPCLILEGEGLAVRISAECETRQNLWSVVMGFQIAAVDGQGKTLCLEPDSNSNGVLARECMCIDNLTNSTCSGNPQAQWFKFIDRNAS